jgi:hypothetical protein
MPDLRFLETEMCSFSGSSGRKRFDDFRARMLGEARGWPSGTREAPLKSPVLARLPDGSDVYFLKPGKEVFLEARPNPFDMTPRVGEGEDRWTFEDIWSNLARISVQIDDSSIYKGVLVLLYRNAFFIDHTVDEGGVRYRPSKDILDFVRMADERLGKEIPHGLIGVLHFLDILGWNEDMKYQSPENLPLFNPKKKPRVGRVNTILTCIRVSYSLSEFVGHIVEKASNKKEIDFRMVLSAMQRFSSSKGISPPTDTELQAWLSPWLKSKKHKSSDQAHLC